ncbi:GNAT family N-acetyltransferase [Alphaproteobacteria bacterium 46_93_T64]|mgnify:CR=1 FL=1|nr:GNAT family N-acetyltransferase [Alphaproteobacteria bacterium 46_93_T64]
MSDSYSIRLLKNISDVSAESWNACLEDDHPFVRYEFLNALEQSGSATAEAGWQPQHLILEEDSKIVGAAPMYLKGHSQGEYVFDHSWAHAYEQAGGRYYPKLQLSVPFSPVTGTRFLSPPHEDQRKRKMLLAKAAQEVAVKYGVSSAHITFLPEADLPVLEECGYLIRTGEQFHWVNNNYDTFDDFLDQLSSRKRKAIKKERRVANAEDIQIEILKGSEIKAEHWDIFFEFYLDTGSRKWGTPYLTRAFFTLISETMAESVLLFMVKQEGRYIAGALNLVSDECLYGRYWGCLEDHRFLHFETCYYRAIDYAIEHGIDRVEAGAQGPHKLARGYLPTKTYSAHWMQDPGFHKAVGDFLVAETKEMDAELSYLEGLSPFKRSE